MAQKLKFINAIIASMKRIKAKECEICERFKRRINIIDNNQF